MTYRCPQCGFTYVYGFKPGVSVTVCGRCFFKKYFKEN